jgi:hypothetical protein
MPSQSVSIAYEQIAYAYSTQNTLTVRVSNAGNATYNIATVRSRASNQRAER